MKRYKYIFVLFLLHISYSCVKEKNKIVFNTSFSGARLDSLITKKDSSFEAIIKPAFEPVNKSPWFAFAVSSDRPKTIELTLNYGDYKHRYIPKLSFDKKTWKKIEAQNISIDTIKGTATLKLSISSKKLYVAAQEIESSKDTYAWVDKMIENHSELKKVIAGKTVQNNNNYCIELESEPTKNSIVLIARQHPPEIPGGTIGFKSFFETLMANTKTAKSFRENFNIYTFPLLNPDGADLGNWRHNANGIDLNRDWVDFTQPETKMVKNYLEEKVSKGTKIQFAIDFHTSYSGPYLLVLDSIKAAKSKKIIPNWIQNIESNSNFKVEARKRRQELPYCYNYFINTFNCEAVTYEDGDEIDRNIIKERAKIYAQNLMKTMLLKLENNEL